MSPFRPLHQSFDTSDVTFNVVQHRETTLVLEKHHDYD